MILIALSILASLALAFGAGWASAMMHRDRAELDRMLGRAPRQPRTAPHWIGSAR
jgi:hypothetical protein